MFAKEIPIDVGDRVCRDGFWFADVAFVARQHRTL
jgi:hypothetical protein